MNIDEVEFYTDEFGNLATRKVIDKSDDIPTKCIACGFTENVPDFIYDEFSRKKFHLKFRKSISTIHCNECQKEKAIPLSWFEK